MAVRNDGSTDAAYRFGLVNRVFEAESFDREAATFLETLASRSASAVALSKRLLYQIEGASFEAAIHEGAQVNVIARLTDDLVDASARAQVRAAADSGL